MAKEKKYPYYLFPNIIKEEDSQDLSIPSQEEFERMFGIDFEKIDTMKNIERTIKSKIDIETKKKIGYLVATAISSKIKDEKGFIGTSINNYFGKAQSLNFKLEDLVNADEITPERCMDAMLILFQNKLVYAFKVRGNKDYPRILQTYSEFGTGIASRLRIYSKIDLVNEVTIQQRDCVRCNKRFTKRAYSEKSINNVIFVLTEIFTQEILGFDYDPSWGFDTIKPYKKTQESNKKK